MDLIDLRNVSDLTGIDINMVDTNTLAPEMEPNRQLYFMAILKNCLVFLKKSDMRKLMMKRLLIF